VAKAHDNSGNEDTDLHVAELKDLIVTSKPVLHACATAAGRDESNNTPRDIGKWDLDAFPIIVDSATTRTITPCLSDLIDPQPFNASLTGLGKGSITHRGKIKWTVIDEKGQHVVIEDNAAYYSEQAPYSLLCPHSWKKHQDEMRYENREPEGD
jgi:hypothetical protein